MRDREYSDEEQARILKSVEKWADDCTQLKTFEKLPKYVQKEFGFVVTSVAEMMYGYHLQSPKRWTAVALEDILINVFPRKMLVQESFFKAVDPALTFFMGYLQQIGVLTEKKAQSLTGRLKKAASVMRQYAKDASSYSPMKQLLLEGMEQGIDITDTDALNSMLKEMDMADLFPDADLPMPVRSQKVGPGAPCPCGNGKKHKKCCGSGAGENTADTAVTVMDAENQGSPPSLEQWKQLYEIADNLKKLAPWEILWSSDLITVLLPNREEPVYCCVMGQGGESFGIGVYPGYKSITGYLRMSDAPADEPPYISLFQQDCLMCHFGDREEVMPQDRDVMKELGLRFRGRNQWIYFRSMKPGYYPWNIDSCQAGILIEALQNLAMAYLYLRKGEIQVDFASGQTLLRFYSPEKEMWLNTATKLMLPDLTEYLHMTDELLLARLKKQQKSRMRLEFDLLYLPVPIQEHKDEIPRLPRMAMLADQKSGLPLDQHMAEPGECIEEVVLDMLCDHILKYGRPDSISVRGKDIGRFLEDTCDKIGVTLIDDKGVPAMNELLEDMLNFMG